MATERKLPEVGEEIHLPGPSAQPLMVALSSTVALIGVTQSTPIIFIVGITFLLITLFQWIRDAIVEFKALPDHHGDHGHGDDHRHNATTNEVEATPDSATAPGNTSAEAH
ncbi:MAG: hypothetical protein Q7T55_03695 [Solirubrobacteraceae bacterium]|nr:hypothetical protein [Solirubrobacteraceae bacterium]